MNTPITQAALDAFKARVAFRGSTESDLVEGVTDLVATMARLERAHAAEREKVKTLRSATDLLMARANDELKSGRPALIAMQWHRIEPIIAALAAMEETK